MRLTIFQNMGGHTLMSTSMNSCLLDTNAAIHIIRGEQAIQQAITNKRVFVPIITIGELFYGAENSGRPNSNRENVERFIRDSQIVNCDLDTTRFYGRVSIQLQRKGRPNQPNDIRIAAIAVQHDLILLTRDAHFQYVDGLTVETW